MKKINILFAILATVLVTVSCETYDDYDENREIVVGFSSPTATITVPADGERSTTLDIFSSEATSTDRTFNIVLVQDQTELPSSAYSFESTVTIPANERASSIEFTAFDDDALNSDGLPVVVRIERANAYVSGGPATITIKTP